MPYIILTLFFSLVPYLGDLIHEAECLSGHFHPHEARGVGGEGADHGRTQPREQGPGSFGAHQVTVHVE